MLCILLLPMITYASMIMDASRLQAAKTAISGAGDLTMNAAMSEYDKVVKDMYGLFSMVQNEDDLDNALKDYFKKTIEGALKDTGTDDQTIQEYADSFANWIIDRQNEGEFDFDDFLSMQVDDMTIGNVSSSALANPAVMKRQIVEYMKYKGPVSLASTLISKLGFLKNSAEQTEVLEQKVEYATSLNTVQEACEAAYKVVEEYNTAAHALNDARNSDKAAPYNMEETVIKSRGYLYRATYAALLANYSPWMLEVYKNAGTKTFYSGRDYDIPNYHSYTKEQSELENMTVDELFAELEQLWIKSNVLIDYSAEGKNSKYEQYGGEVELKYDETNPDKSKIIITDYNDPNAFSTGTLKYYKELTTEQLEYFDSVDENTPPDELFDKIQDVYQTQSVIYGSLKVENYVLTLEPYDVICKAFQSTFKEYEKKLKASLQDPTNSKTQNEINDMLADNEDYQAMKSESAKLKIMTEYFSNSMKEDSIISIANKVRANSTNISCYKKAASIFSKMAANSLKDFYDKISDAYSKIGLVNKSLDDVIDAMNIAEQEKKEWSDSIDKVDDGSTKTSMKSDFDTSTDGISIDEVNNLKEAVTAIQTKLKALKDDFDNISFVGKKILSTPPTFDDIDKQLDTLFVYGQNLVNQMIQGDYLQRVTAFIQSAYMFVYNSYGISPFSCSAKLTNLPQNILQRDIDYLSMISDEYMTDEQKMQYIVMEEYMLNSMSFDDFVKNGYLHGMAGYIDGYKDNPPASGGGELYDKEKFYFTLKSIADPKKSQLSEEDKKTKETQANNINKIVEKGENVDQEESTDDKKKDDNKGDNKKSDDKKENSISVGDILKTVEAYCTTEDIPVAQGEDFDTDTSTAKGIKISSTDKSGYQNSGKSSSESLGQAKSILSKLADLGSTVVEYAYLEEYFTEMFSCDTDRVEILDKQNKENKGKGKLTLSGTTLKTDTEWYGKEVEYMLWGDADLSSNITKNYAMIYLIRFALNAIYAFTAPDIQSFALEVATAIAGWTVVGVPIVQAVITVALALAESGVDIAELRQGKSVAIYKSQTTFVCSPSGLITKGVETIVDYAAEQVGGYIDEKIDDIADGLSGTIGDYIGDGGELRDYAQKYAEEQISMMETKVKDMFVVPLLNKLTPILNEASNKTANMHNLINSAVDSALSTIKNNIDSQPDGILKELEEIAYKKFIEKKFKDGFVNSMNDFFVNVENHISSESLEQKINDRLDEVRKSISDKVTEFSNKIFDKLMNEFEAKKDQTVDKAKDIVHDKVSEFSDELSGKISDVVSSHVKDTITSIDSGSSGGFTLDYKEYCKIFVFLNIAMNEQKMLKRCAALVGANVKNADKDHNNFDIEKAFTLVYVSADIKMNTLFPWGVENTYSDTTGDNSYGFNLGNMGSNSVKVHYDAMNGY